MKENSCLAWGESPDKLPAIGRSSLNKSNQIKSNYLVVVCKILIMRHGQVVYRSMASSEGCSRLSASPCTNFELARLSFVPFVGEKTCTTKGSSGKRNVGMRFVLQPHGPLRWWRRLAATKFCTKTASNISVTWSLILVGMHMSVFPALSCKVKLGSYMVFLAAELAHRLVRGRKPVPLTQQGGFHFSPSCSCHVSERRMLNCSTLLVCINIEVDSSYGLWCLNRTMRSYLIYVRSWVQDSTTSSERRNPRATRGDFYASLNRGIRSSLEFYFFQTIFSLADRNFEEDVFENLFSKWSPLLVSPCSSPHKKPIPLISYDPFRPKGAKVMMTPTRGFNPVDARREEETKAAKESNTNHLMVSLIGTELFKREDWSKVRQWRCNRAARAATEAKEGMWKG